MKKLIIIVCFFTAISDGISQNLNSARSVAYEYLGEKSSDKKYAYNDIKGSPYENEEFSPGKIFYKGMEPISLLLRFNIYDNVIQYVDNLQIYDLIINEKFLHAEVNGLKLIYSEYVDGTELKKGFFIQLLGGKYNLYKMKRIELSKGSEKASSYEQDKPPSFNRLKDKYYLSSENNSFFLFTGSKKSMQEVFRKDYDVVQEIVKDKKINLKKEEDIIQLITILNQQE